MFKTIFLIFWISYLETCFSLPVPQHGAEPSSKRSNRDQHPLMTQAKFHPFLQRRIVEQSVPQRADQNQPISPAFTVIFDDNSTSLDPSIFAPSVDDQPAAGAVAFDNPHLFLTNTNIRPTDDDQFLVFPDSRSGTTARPSANEPTRPSQGVFPPIIGPLPSSSANVPRDGGNHVPPPITGLLPPNRDAVQPPVNFPEEKVGVEQPNDSLPPNTDVQSPNAGVTPPSNELLPPHRGTFPPSIEILPPDRDFYFVSNWANFNNYSYHSSFPAVVPFPTDSHTEENAADSVQRNNSPSTSNIVRNSSLTGALYPLLLPPPIYAIDESQNDRPLPRIDATDQVISDTGEVHIVPKKPLASPADGKFEPVAPNSNTPAISAPTRFFLPPFVDQPNQETIVEIRPPNRFRFVESDAISRATLTPLVPPSQRSPLNRIDIASPITDNEATSTTEKLVIIPVPRHSQAAVAHKEAIIERRPPAFVGGFVPTSNFTLINSSKSFGTFKNTADVVSIEDGIAPFARLSKLSAANAKSTISHQQQRRPGVVIKEQHSPKKDVEVFAPLNPDGAASQPPQPPQPMPPYPQQPPVMYPVDEIFPPSAEEMPAYPPFFTIDQPAFSTMLIDETTSRLTTEENTRATEETTPRAFATRKLLRPTTPTFGHRYTVPTTYSTYAPRFTPFTQHHTPYYATRFYPGYPPTSKPPKVPAPIWPSYTPRPFGQVNADLVAASPQETIVGSTTTKPSVEKVASSQTDIDPNYKLAVVSDYRNYDLKDGTFGFSIGLENGLTAKVRGYKKNGKHVIEGSYSLFANEGEPVNITYVADNEELDEGRIPQRATSI